MDSDDNLIIAAAASFLLAGACLQSQQSKKAPRKKRKFLDKTSFQTSEASTHLTECSPLKRGHKCVQSVLPTKNTITSTNQPTKTGEMKCCYPKCEEKNAMRNRSHFPWPKPTELEMYSQWDNYVRWRFPDFTPPEAISYLNLCELHFEPKYLRTYEDDNGHVIKELRKDACPTVHQISSRSEFEKLWPSPLPVPLDHDYCVVNVAKEETSGVGNGTTVDSKREDNSQTMNDCDGNQNVNVKEEISENLDDSKHKDNSQTMDHSSENQNVIVKEEINVLDVCELDYSKHEDNSQTMDHSGENQNVIVKEEISELFDYSKHEDNNQTMNHSGENRNVIVEETSERDVKNVTNELLTQTAIERAGAEVVVKGIPNIRGRRIVYVFPNKGVINGQRYVDRLPIAEVQIDESVQVKTEPSESDVFCSDDTSGPSADPLDVSNFRLENNATRSCLPEGSNEDPGLIEAPVSSEEDPMDVSSLNPEDSATGSNLPQGSNEGSCPVEAPIFSQENSLDVSSLNPEDNSTGSDLPEGSSEDPVLVEAPVSSEEDPLDVSSFNPEDNETGSNLSQGSNEGRCLVEAQLLIEEDPLDVSSLNPEDNATGSNLPERSNKESCLVEISQLLELFEKECLACHSQVLFRIYTEDQSGLVIDAICEMSKMPDCYSRHWESQSKFCF